jgi:tripartite ATP-independent transporter DctM subunit
MDWVEATVLLIGSILALMAIGFPVAIAFLVTNLIGAWIFIGETIGILQVVDNAGASITRFTLVPVPLFILMGSLFFHTGLALRVFDGLDQLFGRIPGRLCYLTVGGGTLFATLTGSSMANTAMLGSLLVPEMQKRGYSKRLSMGPILGTGGLAMIIPPSTLGVLLATIANIDVGRVLVAGLLPGLVLAALYAGMIFLQVTLSPQSAPVYEVESTSPLSRLLTFATHVLPMGLVIFLVVGLIVLGVTTPSEAAAFGVLGVLVLALAFRCLNWETIKKSLFETVKVSGMVLFIMMNSTVFSQLLSFSGASSGLLSWASGFEVAPIVVVLILLGVLLAMGMFMDPVSMMLITVPIFYPLITTLGFDVFWFSMLVLMSLEMSMTTPPFGILLFVMLGVAPKGTTLFQVASYAFPFLVCDAILIALMIMFPMLVLYLPNSMG